MTEHPLAKHLEKMAKHHRHTRERHTARATELAADRDLVDGQTADRLAGKVEASTEPGSDHGSSQ